MSLSREIAQRIDQPDELDKIWTTLAQEVLIKGGNRDWFDSYVRKALHGLHAGGYSKDKLRELRKRARQVYWKLREHRSEVTNRHERNPAWAEAVRKMNERQS